MGRSGIEVDTTTKLDEMDNQSPAIVTQIQQRDLTAMTLDQLGDAARVEVEAVREDLASALTHWINLGEILLVVRESVTDWGLLESWSGWCESIGVNPATAGAAMRLARYRDHIPSDQPLGINEALSTLKGLPDANHRGRPRQYDEGAMQEALDMVSTGTSIKAAAEATGLPWYSIKRRANPDGSRESARRSAERRRARIRDQKAAAKALAEKQERQDRDRLAKTTGGELADAYALVRRLAVKLDAALRDSTPGDQRRSVDAALSMTHRAEDEIVSALRRSREVA